MGQPPLQDQVGSTLSARLNNDPEPILKEIYKTPPRLIITLTIPVAI